MSALHKQLKADLDLFIPQYADKIHVLERLSEYELSCLEEVCFGHHGDSIYEVVDQPQNYAIDVIKRAADYAASLQRTGFKPASVGRLHLIALFDVIRDPESGHISFKFFIVGSDDNGEGATFRYWRELVSGLPTEIARPIPSCDCLRKQAQVQPSPAAQT